MSLALPIILLSQIVQISYLIVVLHIVWLPIIHERELDPREVDSNPALVVSIHLFESSLMSLLGRTEVSDNKVGCSDPGD